MVFARVGFILNHTISRCLNYYVQNRCKRCKLKSEILLMLYSSSLESSSSVGGSSPPAPWYSFPTIGWTTSSSCFFCVLKSSTSASWFFSSHETASLMAASIVSLSSELSFPPSFSLSLTWRAQHRTTNQQYNFQLSSPLTLRLKNVNNFRWQQKGH